MSASDDRIHTIRLDRFRGATRDVSVMLDATKPVVLLVGENGTGKSSLVDAIDAVCNGSRGSIADRSSTSARQHLAAAGARSSDLTAEIETARSTWLVRLSGDTLTTIPPYDGAPVHVLRRASLLTLVNAAPSERFEVLARFLDVANVEKSEATLATAARDASAAAQQIETALRQAAQGLDELWIQEGRPGAPNGTADDWARSQNAVAVDELESAATRAGAGAQAAGQLARDAEARTTAESRATDARLTLDAAVRALSAISRAGVGREVARILADTEKLLGASTLDDCPVCERPIDAAALRARVSDRLRAAHALTDAVAAVEAAERTVRVADDAVTANRERVVVAARALAALLTPDRLPPELQAAVHALRSDDPPDALGDATVLSAAAPDLRDRAASRAAKSQQQIGHIKAVRAGLAQLEARRDELDDARRIGERLTDVLTIVRRERTAYVQEVLDAVRDECNRLYAAIHPDERLALRRLRLDEKRRRSLHQDADFEGIEGVPPQAYFSESHLDTLGFCFWLAVTKHAARGGRPPIVVLDDVFASADAAHAARVLALLVAERDAFTQVIVATHQRTWADSLGVDSAAEAIDVVALDAWSLGTGIAVRHG